MESGASRHVQHALGTAFAQVPDEEVPFPLSPLLPIDQFVPFLDETLDVLCLVMVGLANFCRVGGGGALKMLINPPVSIS